MKNQPTITMERLNALCDAARGDIEAAHEAALFLNVDFWDCHDSAEVLRDRDIDEAVESYLDDCDGLPDSLHVTGYRRAALGPHDPDADSILEYIYEQLDDEYNGGDEPSEPTKAVLTAAEALVTAIRREYTPWNCEDVVCVTLNAAEIREIGKCWDDPVAASPVA